MTFEVTKDNVEFVFGILRDRIADGLTFAAAKGGSLYYDAVTENTHPLFPTGPFRQEDSSKPGEYPARRTGQGAENIDHQAASPSPPDGSGLESRFGVRGSATGFGPFGPNETVGGFHLIELMKSGRLGPDQTVRESLPVLQESFRNGARRKA